MDTSAVLQIQPQYARGGAWEALAKREGLFYELLEASVPPALASARRLSACLDWYQKSGRVRSVHGAFIDINPASGDAAVARVSRERCLISCRIAQSLHAERVVFHSGAFPFLRGRYLADWAARTADYYASLCEMFDLSVCVENSQDVDPEPILRLLQCTDDKRIGVCLDVGHAHYSRAPIGAWFEAFSERIGCLHLSDNNGRFDEHLPLGGGTVDWEEVGLLYEKLGRRLPVTIEVGSVEEAEAACAFLRAHGYFGLGE